MKDIIVYYHGNCTDGFGAAWAAWKKFGDEAQYVQIFYGTPFSRDLTNKDVYVLDFTHTTNEMTWLLENNKSVTVIDHHSTKEEESKISNHRIFDLNHSGAILSWNFFHPAKPVPLLLLYVEDYDLWHHKLPDTDLIRKYIIGTGFAPGMFNDWNTMALDLENPEKKNHILNNGAFIKKYENNIYDQLEDQAYLVSFEGFEVYAVNAPGWFTDLLAERLYKKRPPFAIIWRENKESIHVSLRSDGSINVAEICKKYSHEGGGHPASAAFRLALGTQFPWKRV